VHYLERAQRGECEQWLREKLIVAREKRW
jgi:hypothetical protein